MIVDGKEIHGRRAQLIRELARRQDLDKQADATIVATADSRGRVRIVANKRIDKAARSR